MLEAVGSEVIPVLVVVVVVIIIFALVISYATLWAIQSNPSDTTELRSFSYNTRCPICLESECYLPCTTNCGHTYCGECLVNYWRSLPLGVVLCPTCRRTITLIIPPTDNSSNSTYVRSQIGIFNRLHRSRSWYETVLDAPVLLPFLWNRLTNFVAGGDAISLFIRFRIYATLLLVLLYVLSPFDIVPESIMGIIGIIDDVVFVLLAVMYLCSIVRVILSNAH